MSKINKIKVGEVSYDIQDLSVGDLESLPTEDKTNIVNAINEVFNNSGYKTFVWSGKYTDEDKIMFQEWLDEYWKTNIWNNIVFYQNGSRYVPIHSFELSDNNNKIYIMFGFFDYGNAQKQLNYLDVTISLDNTLKTITSITGSTYLKTALYTEQYQYGTGSYLTLTTNNTRAYTPKQDYHPATKKYVDTAIADAITTVLEGEY